MPKPTLTDSPAASATPTAHQVSTGIQPADLPDSRMQSHLHRLGVFFALGLAFALRLYRLERDSLWYDEIVSVDLARVAIPELLAQTARDIHPPGYYLSLHFWRGFSRPIMELGSGFEFLYAFPSVLFGVLVCSLIYAVGKRLFTPSAGLWALLFAAIHPFQIAYSQEVRMYTLGALLCLLYILGSHTLFATNPRLRRKGWRVPGRIAALLGCTIAAGLYTFYYFAFLAITTGGLAVVWTLRQSPRRRFAPLLFWLDAHLLGGLLWLPWLPTFLRQALEPPVPAWREEWRGIGETGQALVQTLHTYLYGHVFSDSLWIGSITALLIALTLAYVYFRHNQPPPASAWRKRITPHLPDTDDLPRIRSTVIAASFTFGPPLLIILLSATITPLFHPRYLYVFHPLFLVLLGASIAWLYHRHKPTAILGALLLSFLFLFGSRQLLIDPTLQSDDHRGAVARIAQEWRPGEVVLVNAGWAYRVFNVYWPRRIIDAHSVLPPPLTRQIRLMPETGGADVSAEAMHQYSPDDATRVPLIYTGSVDGASTLGWGNRHADFFPISQADTRRALDELAATTSGFWHYRIYDTVNDPQQTIRTWLAQHSELLFSEPIRGKDFLRLEHYRPTESSTESSTNHSPARPVGEQGADVANAATDTAIPNRQQTIRFSQAISLTGSTVPDGFATGHMLYLPLHVEFLTGNNLTATEKDEYGISLRLLDGENHVRGQLDTRVAKPVGDLRVMRHTLALPVPAGLPPGPYHIGIIVYDIDTLIPLSPLASPEINPQDDSEANLPVAPDGSLLWGKTELRLPGNAPRPMRGIARFDYIHLHEAKWTPVVPADARDWELRLAWQPHAADYKDTYQLEVDWVDARGETAASWQAMLGAPHYPSGEWQTDYFVGQTLQFSIPETVPPATYRVHLSVRRANDEAIIPGKTGWGLRNRKWLDLGNIRTE